MCLPFGISDTPSSVTLPEDSLKSIECINSSMNDIFLLIEIKVTIPELKVTILELKVTLPLF